MKRPLILIVLISSLLAALPAVGAETENALSDALSGIGVHGFVSQGFLQSFGNDYIDGAEDGTFQFNEIGINFSKTLGEDLRIGIQLLSRDLGPAGNNEVTVDWAYADWRWRNWLGIQVGIIRPSIGLYNETRDLDVLRTGIFLPQGVYDKNYWDRYAHLQGGSVYGDIGLGNAGTLSYGVQAGSYALETDGEAARLFESMGLGTDADMDSGVIFNGFLEYQPPLDGLRVRLSAQKGTQAEMTTRLMVPVGPGVFLPSDVHTDFTNLETQILSVEYTWENLKIAAEYARIVGELTIMVDLLPAEYQPAPLDQTSEGYYVSASYRFTDWFELGAGYTAYYPNKHDRGGDRYVAMGQDDFNAWYRDVTLSLRFDPMEHWVAKVEGHLVDGTASVLNIDNPDGFDRHWSMVAAKLTFSF